MKTLEYSLRVLIYPLDWFALFNRFEFDTSLYISIYSMVGLITLVVCAGLWIFCRVTTKLRYPPPFNGLKPVLTILQTTTGGCLLAVTPISICLCITLSYLKSWGLSFPFRWLTALGNFVNLLPADWYNQNSTDIYTGGRVGVSLLSIGLYVSFTGAKATHYL